MNCPMNLCGNSNVEYGEWENGGVRPAVVIRLGLNLIDN